MIKLIIGVFILGSMFRSYVRKRLFEGELKEKVVPLSPATTEVLK